MQKLHALADQLSSSWAEVSKQFFGRPRGMCKAVWHNARRPKATAEKAATGKAE